MDQSSTFGLGATVSVVLTLLNQVIVWKLWPSYVQHSTSAKQKTILSFLCVDPLVASIACPMAADIFFTFGWSISCEPGLVLSISFVMMVLYTCSIVLCYRLVVVMTPASSSCTSSLDVSNNLNLRLTPPLLQFVSSMLFNVFLTLAFLGCMHGSSNFNYDPEWCAMTLIKRSLLFIFVLCSIVQTIHILFYAQLSVFNAAQRKAVSQSPSKLKVGWTCFEECADLPADSEARSVVMYSLAAVFCLLMVSVLRFTYLMCSCNAYIDMASSLYYAIWLVVLKLPCAGPLLWLVSKFGALRS